MKKLKTVVDVWINDMHAGSQVAAVADDIYNTDARGTDPGVTFGA